MGVDGSGEKLRVLQPTEDEPTVYSKASRGPTPRIVAEWIDGRAAGCHQRGGTSYVVVRAGQLRLNAFTVEFAHGALVSQVSVSSSSVPPSARWSCCGSPSGTGDKRARWACASARTLAGAARVRWWKSSSSIVGDAVGS